MSAMSVAACACASPRAGAATSSAAAPRAGARQLAAPLLAQRAGTRQLRRQWRRRQQRVAASTEEELDQQLQQDLERLRQRQQQQQAAAPAGSSAAGQQAAASAGSSESGGALGGMKETIDKVLIADFFFVLFALAWLGAALAERSTLQSTRLLDTWLSLWQWVFQPAIGVLMLGALVSGAVGWAKDNLGGGAQR